MENTIVQFTDDNLTLDVNISPDEDTVWLSQAQMAELFKTTPQNITLHIKNIYHEKELSLESTCKDFLQVRQEGSRTVKRKQKFYNLDAILSVGYRVNSRNATLFRRWSNSVLKEYLLKGHAINYRLQQIDTRLQKHERQIKYLTDKVDFFVRTSLPPVEGVFYDGQIFDAYKFATDLIRSAGKSLLLIDNYIDESVLLMLSKRRSGVCATVYTQKITAQLQLDIEKHNRQYPPVEIRIYNKCHDRFLIIDNTEVYHIGASLKDLGKKMFAFSRMDIPADTITKMFES